MSTEITLHNVELLSLRERITGYRLLFAVESPRVQVRGIFRDKGGELAFLEREDHELDVKALGRRHYLPIQVDGQWVGLAPLDDIIPTVKITERDAS